MTPPDGDTTRCWLDREEHTPYEARAGLTYYKKLRYIPADKTDEAASRTLEDTALRHGSATLSVGQQVAAHAYLAVAMATP